MGGGAGGGGWAVVSLLQGAAKIQSHLFHVTGCHQQGRANSVDPALDHFRPGRWLGEGKRKGAKLSIATRRGAFLGRRHRPSRLGDVSLVSQDGGDFP